jgi:hypothetical protein
VVNGPEDRPAELGLDAVDWDWVDWSGCEREVRRLRQRIFKATQDGDWPRVRSLQRLTAPRGALSYPRRSREELEGRFLGLMANLDPKW